MKAFTTVLFVAMGFVQLLKAVVETGYFIFKNLKIVTDFMQDKLESY